MRSLPTRLAVLAATGLASAATVGVVASPASAQAAAPRCGNGAFAVTRTYGQGGAGHSWMSLVYRNISGHACTVGGYPGVDAVTRSGHVLAHAKRTLAGYGGGGTLRTITVSAGGYASAGVEWLNFTGQTGGACRFSSAIDTVVANTSRVHRVAASVSVCGLQVHPTVAGTPQYPHYGPAQHYWLVGATVDASGTNYYLRKAAYALKTAKQYPTQVAELNQLISFPPTGLTKTQVKQARADVKALDSFFATPGLYS